MPQLENENQILPFFIADNLPKNTAFEYREFDYEKYKIYVVGSLFSQTIGDIDKHISVGLDFLVDNFSSEQGEILDRMKSAIFHSGDKLADFLLSLQKPVDDVDYSLAMVAFYEGIVYVWLDGSLNLRIYRGTESIIVNEESQPQFFGSSTVELGDIFVIGYDHNLKKSDPKTEDYVLDKAVPNYPGLFLDYQIEPNLNVDSNLSELNNQAIVSEKIYETNISSTIIDDSDGQGFVVEPSENLPQKDIEPERNVVNVNADSYNYTSTNQNQDIDEDLQAELAAKEFASPIPQRNLTNSSSSTPKSTQGFDLSALKTKISEISNASKNKFSELQSSGFFDRLIQNIKSGGNYIWQVLLNITSAILDFIFGIIYRNSPHQFKRFQGSIKKRNFQYLIILVLVVSLSYLLFFRGLANQNASGVNSSSGVAGVSPTQSENDTKVRISDKLTTLKSYYDTGQVQNFASTYADLKTLVASAQKSNFSNVDFLNQTLITAQSYEDLIYKVTPISKVDEAFLLPSGSQNANLVDFSTTGTDVYAIDRANSAVLKSNSSTQQFEVFASDSSLSAMTNIACDGASCYITDENQGLVMLDVQNKTFNKFSALKTAGQGVTQIAIYKVASNTYIYTLNPSQGKVIKYTKQGQGLTTPDLWNKSGGFSSDTVDFTVDGNIFEMSSSGSLRKFYNRALVDSSNFAGLGTSIVPLGTNLQIATTIDSAPARFYIADPSNSRIVVYDKDLGPTLQFTFKGSYKYRGTDSVNFSNIKQIELSDDGKFLYGLNNNVVFKVSVSAI